MDVKAIREKLHMTQAELAQKTGIPRDRIAKWEQGKGVPKAEDQRVLEKILGKNVPTAAETPQNGQQNKPDPIKARPIIGQFLEFIKGKTGFTTEDIAEMIGRGRSYLTTLGKKGDHSEAVYRKLQEKFPEIYKEFTKEDKPETPQSDQYLMKLLNYLERDKEWFQKQFESSLTGLMLGQKSLIARVETILDKDNEREAGGNKKKEQQLKEETDRRVGEKLFPSQQMGNTSNR